MQKQTLNYLRYYNLIIEQQCSTLKIKQNWLLLNVIMLYLSTLYMYVQS